jgi:hypothetical protein
VLGPTVASDQVERKRRRSIGRVASSVGPSDEPTCAEAPWGPRPSRLLNLSCPAIPTRTISFDLGRQPDARFRNGDMRAVRHRPRWPFLWPRLQKSPRPCGRGRPVIHDLCARHNRRPPADDRQLARSRFRSGRRVSHKPRVVASSEWGAEQDKWSVSSGGTGSRKRPGGSLSRAGSLDSACPVGLGRRRCEVLTKRLTLCDTLDDLQQCSPARGFRNPGSFRHRKKWWTIGGHCSGPAMPSNPENSA